MQTRQILIVEDDNETVELWGRDIVEFNNGQSQMRFVPYYARSRNAAMHVLDTVRIHCVVADLRLPDDDGGNTDQAVPNGNRLVEQLLQTYGTPVYVYSGFPEETSELVVASRVRIVKKQRNGAMEILKGLSELGGLMQALSDTRGKIETEAARIFSESIWPRWEDVWRKSGYDAKIVSVITRQIVSQVSEHLLLPPSDCDVAEFYIVPPLSSDRLRTGDLVKFDGGVFVLVTPRCNLSHKYPPNLMLAKCEEMKDQWSSLRNRLAGNRDDRKDAKTEVKKLATQDYSTSTHFLPPLKEAGPWQVQFKHVVTIKTDEEMPALMAARFASIAAPFIPNLIQRYAAYLGRLGQPNLDVNCLCALAIREESPSEESRELPTERQAQSRHFTGD